MNSAELAHAIRAQHPLLYARLWIVWKWRVCKERIALLLWTRRPQSFPDLIFNHAWTLLGSEARAANYCAAFTPVELFERQVRTTAIVADALLRSTSVATRHATLPRLEVQQILNDVPIIEKLHPFVGDTGPAHERKLDLTLEDGYMLAALPEYARPIYREYTTTEATAVLRDYLCSIDHPAYGEAA